jgi:hypothetical protein
MSLPDSRSGVYAPASEREPIETPPASLSLLDYALAAVQADIAVLPPKEDGTKMPISEPWIDANGRPIIDPNKGTQGYGWKHRETFRATPADILKWYGDGRRTGFGVACGAVSAKLLPLPDGLIGPPIVLGLEMWEFEQRERWDALVETAHEVGLGDLVERIANGYLTATPGGGLHTCTRCSEYEGNLKLAMRPATPEELAVKPGEDRKVIAETRGQGGFTVEPPSRGRVHPSRKPYVLERGGLDTVVTITPDERQLFKSLIESFNELPDEMPDIPAEDAAARRELDDDLTFTVGPAASIDDQVRLDPATNYDGPTALDVIAAYNEHTTWNELLTRHGWRHMSGTTGGVEYWKRPGKTDPGHSATTNFGGSGKLCVFSPTPGLKVTAGKKSKAGYDRFGFFAAVEHHGDNKAAVRAASALLNMRQPSIGRIQFTRDGGIGYFSPPSKNGHAPDEAEPIKRVDNASLNASDESSDDQEGEGLNAFSAFSRRGFPTECLPEPARRYVETARQVIGAPRGYVALPLLVYAGAAMGNEHRIEVGEYSERPVLYGGVIGEPGSAKSPANRVARHPLDVLQREAYEQYTKSLASFERNLSDWESLPHKEQATISKPTKPMMAHYFTTNATLEAITAIVRDNRGLAVAPDELVAVITSMDAYRSGKGSDRQSYLSLWDGAPLKIDRKAAEPIYVPHPVVGVVGGIQPEVLKDLAKDGRRDGFVDRFLWVADAAPPPDWTDEVIGADLKATMTDVFRRLRASTAEHPVMVGPEARERWRRWFNSNQRTVIASTGLIRGIYAKLPRQLLRIALIIHALAHPDAPADVPVSDETMASAVEITEYFRQSANNVAQAFGSEKGTASGGTPDRIHHLLRTSDEWVSRSAIRNYFGRNISSDDIGEALAALEADGVVEMRRRTPDGGKGRPTEEWRAITDIPVRDKRDKRDKSPSPPGSPPDERVRDKYAEKNAINTDPPGADPPAPPPRASSAWRCAPCGAFEHRTMSDGSRRCDGCNRVSEAAS